MKKQARKILGLAAILVPAIAAAEPKIPAHWADATHLGVVKIDETAYLVAPGEKPVVMSRAEYGRYLGETQPLIGPDGRPGCGNVATKAPDHCNMARATALAERFKKAATDPKAAAREMETSRRFVEAAEEAASFQQVAARTK
jgi:hypothetical protein